MQAFTGALALTGAHPVYDVSLEARFYNATDQLIRTEVITPAMPATLPGQTTPFEVDFGFCAEPAPPLHVEGIGVVEL